MFLVKKNNLLFVFSLTTTLLFASSSPIQATNKTKTFLITASVISCGYFLSKSISHASFWVTKNYYTNDLKLFYQHGYEALKKKILLQHEHVLFGPSGPYRNYPLMHYKKILDADIKMLWIFRILNPFSKLGTLFCQKIDELNSIRDCILSDHHFILERRDYENSLIQMSEQ